MQSVEEFQCNETIIEFYKRGKENIYFVNREEN